MKNDQQHPENLELEFDAKWEKAARAGTDPDVAWARDQMKKIVAKASEGAGYFEATCPVCGELFKVAGRTSKPLRRELFCHLARNAPAGLEYARSQIGDRVSFGGRDVYEVFDGPYHPFALPDRSPYVKIHTFYVLLRRLNDGRFFKTLPNKPGVVRPIRRPSITSLSPHRKVPYFRLVDRHGLFVFETDVAHLAARASNRLVELQDVRFSRRIPSYRITQFNLELTNLDAEERKAMEAARQAGKRFEKFFSVGMRDPWPPERRDGSEAFNETFSIIDAAGRVLYSTNNRIEAADFWANQPASDPRRKAGLVIAGTFEDPKQITALMDSFNAALFEV